MKKLLAPLILISQISLCNSHNQGILHTAIKRQRTVVVQNLLLAGAPVDNETVELALKQVSWCKFSKHCGLFGFLACSAGSAAGAYWSAPQLKKLYEKLSKLHRNPIHSGIKKARKWFGAIQDEVQEVAPNIAHAAREIDADYQEQLKLLEKNAKPLAAGCGSILAELFGLRWLIKSRSNYKAARSIAQAVYQEAHKRGVILSEEVRARYLSLVME